jgi:hypothetical protein
MPLILALQSASTTPDAVVATVNRFTEFLLGYTGALAAVGALAMALIEAWKKLRDSRTRFQARRWTQWVRSSPFETSAIAAARKDLGRSEPLSRELAYGELLQLCTGVPRKEANDAAQRLLTDKGKLEFRHAQHRTQYPAHALFALDLEHMMGSIQEAADIALASPGQNESLYVLMTSGADPTDISTWYEKGPESMIATVKPGEKAKKSIKDQSDRFARLRQIVKRRLDGFQIYSTDRWGAWNQTRANIVGIAVLFAVLLRIKANNPGGSPGYLAIGILSLFGGILSPVAKDLVTALKRVKDG